AIDANRANTVNARNAAGLIAGAALQITADIHCGNGAANDLRAVTRGAACDRAENFDFADASAIHAGPTNNHARARAAAAKNLPNFCAPKMAGKQDLRGVVHALDYVRSRRIIAERAIERAVDPDPI